ncbi:ribonucleotide-diphosphate reductase subunit beta [Deinococcus murrayi]|uniref:ribonucleotide-diphosphate reductase subunit beta n=1 Tax=Deinococcus murrayi TaxID=68910 RepID=UPI000489A1CF|nr:ribonucleotide-diphosphate reductase subunit beta [Deinococcus murrayi]
MSKSATNWSEAGDGFTQAFYVQQQAQLWFSEEIPIASDAADWRALSPAERQCYTRVSAGLNAMDTLQGEVGMPLLAAGEEDHQRKATLAMFAFMENVHARSYSMANKTFLSASEERDAFEWIEAQPHLQRKITAFRRLYEEGDALTRMMASCLLETALFYSGFFYPLYLAGQGKMSHMGEVFTLICADEALHGTYVGLLFQERFAALPEDEQAEVRARFEALAREFYENECGYTDEVYAALGLASEVKKFVRYNFNICCDNLGLERLFPDEEVNPLVLNGIRTTGGTTHDFFSIKGAGGYSKIAVTPLTDAAVREAWDA